jgi:hypothetical protein
MVVSRAFNASDSCEDDDESSSASSAMFERLLKLCTGREGIRYAFRGSVWIKQCVLAALDKTAQCSRLHFA